MDKRTTNITIVDLAKITTYEAGVVQSQAHRKLKKAMSDYLRPYQLTMMEWFALGLIKDSQKDGMIITELSKQLQTTLPYTTNLISHLVNKGFVIRDSHDTDNRSKVLSLAPGMRKKCEKIETALRVSLRELIYHNISPKELATYIKVLYLISTEK